MPLKMHENETMTPRERVEAVLKIKEPFRVPFIPSFIYAPGRLTGMTIQKLYFNILKLYNVVKKDWNCIQ